MYEFYPYYTNDGSVGLFSPEADDIYHSTYGALTEAYQKFVLPLNLKKFIETNSEIKILDICFGIGYNTKSFLNNFIEIINNDTIYTNNIKYNYKIDTNNKKYKIFVHAIDKDKNLALLSPFFKSFSKNISKENSKSEFLNHNEKIKHLLKEKAAANFSLKKEVNILLLEKIYKKIDKSILEILKSKQYKRFFDNGVIDFYGYLKYLDDRNQGYKNKLAFLHNIYYKYVSFCNKNALKYLKSLDFNFKLSIDDARKILKSDNNVYNFIFLDAFTPNKCPCLWTIHFFKLLYNLLDDNGMILTYSTSALVRNTFLNAGFNVGKIYLNSANKFIGTIAAKNKSLITASDSINSNIIKKYELSEYDLGLMKTKAGIFYRDKNLTLDNEAILNAHKKDVDNSNLISSSKYIKKFKDR